jgi:hypothetical protein
MNKCTAADCNADPTIKSIGTDNIPRMYCDHHFLRYIKESTDPINHITSSLLFVGNESQIQGLTLKVEKVLKKMNEINRKSLETTQQLIKIIINNHIEIIKTTKVIRKQLKVFHARIKLKIPVNLNLVRKIENGLFSCPDYNEISEDIINELKISNSLSFNSEKEDDYAFIFPTSSKPIMINLETFEKSNLDFAPIQGRLVQFAKVSKDNYFLNGGYNDCRKSGESFLLNINQKTSKPLFRTMENTMGACICKDRIVYIFGGCGLDLKSPQDICYAYDIETCMQNSIPKLSQKSYGNSAGIYNNQIYVSGYHMNKLLLLNTNSFSEVVDLEGSVHRIVCDGWILISNILYEMREKNPKDWISHKLNYYSLIQLNSYCSFRRENFIYFAEETHRLMRVVLDLKRIEPIFKLN